MILAWQSVEDKVDQMTVQEFGLLLAPRKEDPRVNLIREEIGLRGKIEFLKSMGRISANDANAIHRFADERNKLFHGDVFTSPNPVEMPEAEKTRLMELARKAAQITMNRTVGSWYDEGTEDMGNKNVPKPDKPKGVKFLDSIRDGSLTLVSDEPKDSSGETTR